MVSCTLPVGAGCCFQLALPHMTVGIDAGMFVIPGGIKAISAGGFWKRVSIQVSFLTISLKEAFHSQAPPLDLVLPEDRGPGRAQRDFSSPRAAREHLQGPREPQELFLLPLPFQKWPQRCCPAPAPCM